MEFHQPPLPMTLRTPSAHTTPPNFNAYCETMHYRVSIDCNILLFDNLQLPKKAVRKKITRVASTPFRGRGLNVPDFNLIVLSHSTHLQTKIIPNYVKGHSAELHYGF